MEVSILEARDLIATEFQRLQPAEPLEISVLEARDAIVIQAKPRRIRQEIGTIKVLDVTSEEFNVSTSIGVKPRDINEVQQSIAIRIGRIHTLTDGTQQRRKQKPFHGSQSLVIGRMTFTTQPSVGERDVRPLP
jgi:hypothetical protein